MQALSLGVALAASPVISPESKIGRRHQRGEEGIGARGGVGGGGGPGSGAGEGGDLGFGPCTCATPRALCTCCRGSHRLGTDNRTGDGEYGDGVEDEVGPEHSREDEGGSEHSRAGVPRRDCELCASKRRVTELEVSRNAKTLDLESSTQNPNFKP